MNKNDFFLILIGFLLITFVYKTVRANSFETIGGGVTYHLIADGASSQYQTKWSQDGKLIFNPLFGIQYNFDESEVYQTVRLFEGSNSIGKQIYGGTYSVGLRTNQLYLGFLLGTYFQDDNEFTKLGIEPYSVHNEHGWSAVPLMGLEANIFLVHFDGNKYLKLNNIITPVLTNHTLSLGIDLNP